MRRQKQHPPSQRRTHPPLGIFTRVPYVGASGGGVPHWGLGGSPTGASPAPTNRTVSPRTRHHPPHQPCDVLPLLLRPRAVGIAHDAAVRVRAHLILINHPLQRRSHPYLAMLSHDQPDTASLTRE